MTDEVKEEEIKKAEESDKDMNEEGPKLEDDGEEGGEEEREEEMNEQAFGEEG